MLVSPTLVYALCARHDVIVVVRVGSVLSDVFILRVPLIKMRRPVDDRW